MPGARLLQRLIFWLINGSLILNMVSYRKPIAVKAGEVVLLPAEKPHAVKATTRFKMVLTMIRS